MLESTIRLFEQLRSHGEVSLGCAQTDMAEIGGQRRKQTLDVRILSVPFGQPMNRECVAQIMKPRLEVRIVAAFDALRSVAGARSLYRQPGPQWGLPLFV